MKLVLGFTAAVTLGLGVWAGLQAPNSASVVTGVQMALAVVFGGNLVFSLWFWRRAAPDSGDAMVLPTVAAMAASMLVGLLPKLLWPEADGVHLASSLLSVVLITGVFIRQLLLRRRMRRV